MPVICTKEQETHRHNVNVELCLDQDSLSALSSQESQHHSIFPRDEVESTALCLIWLLRDWNQGWELW